MLLSESFELGSKSLRCLIVVFLWGLAAECVAATVAATNGHPKSVGALLRKSKIAMDRRTGLSTLPRPTLAAAVSMVSGEPGQGSDEANVLSQHKDTQGWGQLDPLVTGGLPSLTDYHIKLLHHGLRSFMWYECQEIVNEALLEMTVNVKIWHAF